MSKRVIFPGATLGVLGGGQLGRMFAQAASQMGYRVVAYCPEQNAPVSQVCDETICAEYSDKAELERFAKKVEVVTLEFENVPAAAAEIIEAKTLLRPGASVLSVCQNRVREKQFLEQKKFPVTPFAPVNSMAELYEAITKLGTPCVIKTAGSGYDGKGQRIIKTVNEAEAAYKSIGECPAILEKYIAFEREVSVIGARGITGDFVAYGPIENVHENHILDLSFAPARLTWTVAEEAIDITRSVMDALDVVGLLCIEFFVTTDETLLINELAPRPHNSGHFTIEACPASQFEQQVRSITGLPLGATETERGAAMANLLGDLWQNGVPDFPSALALPEVHLHLYGKTEPRKGRKMGHLTAVARWADEAVERVTSARDLLTAGQEHKVKV